MSEAHISPIGPLSPADRTIGTQVLPLPSGRDAAQTWRRSTARAQARAESTGRDWSLWAAALVAALFGLVALGYSYSHHLVLIYSDAGSHLNIARRVLDSRTPGIAQLGTVWLPVPHILMQPFIQDDFLWHTGLAGSIVGFACYEVAAVSLFLSVRLIVRHELAAWIGMAVFITNPNVLYVQTTALTEPVLLGSMTASAYFLLRWSKRESQSDLLTAGLLSMLAVGSRYDGWFFTLVAALLVAVIAYLRWGDRDRAEGTTMAFLAWPVYAMFMWFFYNWLIFGDPLAFQHGEFSAQAQQLALQAAGHLPTKGHLGLSIVTYSWTALYNLGSLMTVLALAGLLVYVVRTRFRPDSLIPYAFLSGFPFNIMALVLGQTVIWTPHGTPALYFNMRYGLMILPGAALFIGFLADYLMAYAWRIVVGLLFLLLLSVQGLLWVPNWPLSVVTVADGVLGLSQKGLTLHAALYLRSHYKGGGILYDDSLSGFITQAQLNMRDYVLNGDTWDKALKNPAPYVEWVVMQPTRTNERVVAALFGKPNFTQHYTLWYSAEGYFVYHRNDASSLPNRLRLHTTLPLGTQFYFAGGENDAHAHAVLDFLNPTTTIIVAQLTFYFVDGSTDKQWVNLNPASSRRVTISSVEPTSGLFGMSIQATGEIAASLDVYRDGSAGDSLLTNSGLSTHWVLRQSRTQFTAQEQLGLLNPNGVPAHVTLRFQGAKPGQTSSRKVTLQPHSDPVFTLKPATSVVVDVQSDQPIAAERTVRLGATGPGTAPAASGGKISTNWLSAEPVSAGSNHTYYTIYSPTCAAEVSGPSADPGTRGTIPGHQSLLAVSCRDTRQQQHFLLSAGINPLLAPHPPAASASVRSSSRHSARAVHHATSVVRPASADALPPHSPPAPAGALVGSTRKLLVKPMEASPDSPPTHASDEADEAGTD